MKTFCLASGLALAAAAAVGEDPPSFCKGLDCPSFSTSQVDNDIEVREYDALLWASTVVEDSSVTDAGGVAFGRLFGYLSGDNEKKQKIDMTTPVLNHIEAGTGPNCNSTFTVSFFVPWQYQNEEGPPSPTSDLVFIETKKLPQVAVAEFSGFADDKSIVQEASVLYDAIIDSKDIDVDEGAQDAYFFAAYDSPYTLFNRHNEDWVPIV